MSEQGDAVTDGTGFVTVPDKARGHLSSAFNAFCPMMSGDKLDHCTNLNLLYPAAYYERIQTFWTLHAL